MSHQSRAFPILTILAAVALLGAFAIPFAGLGNLAWFGCGGLVVLSIVLLGIRDVTHATQLRNVRTDAIHQIGDRLGFEFVEKSDVNPLGWSESFRLTRQSIKQAATVREAKLSGMLASAILPVSLNVISHGDGQRTLAIMDCMSDRGEDRDTIQTVMVIQSSEFGCEHFALVPGHLPDRMLDLLRRDTNNFGRYRAISKDPRVLQLIDADWSRTLDGKLTVECGEGFLMLYRANRLLPHDDWETFLRQGSALATFFSQKVQQLNACSALVPEKSRDVIAHPPATLRMLGRDWTTEQFGNACIAFGVLIAMLMLTGLHSVVVVMMVLASTVVLLWAINNANAAEQKNSAE